MSMLDGLLGVVLKVYQTILRGVSFFHPRARLLIAGQDESYTRLKTWRSQFPNDKVMWLHAASLGEFEQGRPVMEEFKRQFPDAKVVLTFYSPSGYEVRKNYSGADLILYLPLDTPFEMHRWVKCLHPTLLTLVKYEVWPNMLLALKKSEIPVVMISGIFRKEQRFFSGLLKGYWSNVLRRIDYFHVQDETSFSLLKGIGVDAMEVSGDTRYDRVAEVAMSAKLDERYLRWKADSTVVVLGSSYPIEEEAVVAMVDEYPKVKWVIAPHHIDEENIQRIERLFKGKTQRATGLGELNNAPILLLNTMGELGGIYKLGEIAIIGGGWGKGIHNVLEPAAHGCAVIWGPNAQKFLEAQTLREVGGGVQLNELKDLEKQLRRWLENNSDRQNAGKTAREMIHQRTGAKDKVLKTMAEIWEGKKR